MSKKILVVDDEELLMGTLPKLLEKNGYEVYKVRNGADALVMIDEEDFDLIITDVRMPGVDGVKTMKTIDESLKTNKKLPIPVIFITGYADEKLEAEARKMNPIAYLFKPFHNQEILDLVRKAIGS